jgi:hypothetical protein
MFTFTKKRVLTMLCVVGVFAVAVAATAYWTTSGSGNGSGTAGTSSTITVTGDPADGIFPGSSSAVTTTIANDSATQAQYVKNLHVAISLDATHADAGCDASWFTYRPDSETTGDTNPYTVALNNEVAASDSMTVDGKVFMADTATNQDACKGATVKLAYTVDNDA